MTRELLTERVDDTPALIERIVDLSLKSRKNGIVSLEDEMGDGVDPFLKKALTMAIDGMELHEIRAVMDLDMDLSERRLEAAAGVYESAGGFAPTIGIIGAVLGLITVMGDLGDMSKVGKGIAGAFVATIYGVGAANVLFLPAGHKLRMRAVTGRDRQELIVEGVCGIAEGLNPKLIRSKLEAYLPTAANTRTGRGSETSRRRAA